MPGVMVSSGAFGSPAAALYQTLPPNGWFNHEDTQRRERVAVLGSQAAFELFSAIPTVGEEITLNGLRFTVVGVLQTKGQLASYSAPDRNAGKWLRNQIATAPSEATAG